MENIRYYLEAMFAHLPNTEAVRKAKDELLQMMEDKYNELIAEGHSENEAVGTVITEFGNLEELAESLGISTEVHEEQTAAVNSGLRKIGYDEAKLFLRSSGSNAALHSLGIFLLISCVCGPIASSAMNFPTEVGVSVMFLMAAGGIVVLSYSASRQSKWNYVRKSQCYIDLKTAEHVYAEKENYRSIHSLRKALGVAFIAFCWLPAAIVTSTGSVGLTARLGGAFLFLLLGAGICLLSLTNRIMKSYDRLLRMNDQATVAGGYVPAAVQYKSPAAEFVLRVYWITVVCLYLILSFLTFRWDLTWMIWPVAAVVYTVLMSVLRKEI